MKRSDSGSADVRQMPEGYQVLFQEYGTRPRQGGMITGGAEVLDYLEIDNVIYFDEGRVCLLVRDKVAALCALITWDPHFHGNA